MRVKRLLGILENADPEALIVLQYPPHRCQSAHGRLPGLAYLDDAEVIDTQMNTEGGYITNSTPAENIIDVEQLRLIISKDHYP